jgi:uncharacterized protein
MKIKQRKNIYFNIELPYFKFNNYKKIINITSILNQVMNKNEKEHLLNLARKAIVNPSLKNDTPISDALKEKRGVFVTLTKKGELRGCIGYIIPIKECYKAVIECAQNAAYQDPRFPPVSKDEINSLHIEISILTIPKKLEYKNAKDLLNKLKPNKDGVIIKKGYAHATFLPQVWEQLPDKKEFLGHLCMKAGLSYDEWNKVNLDVEIYNVEKFEEINEN